VEGHVAHARNFAVWEADVDFKVQALRDEHPAEAPIIVYCGGGNCDDSKMLAEKLHAAGFTNVRVYESGFPDWQQKGRPIETGAGR
jgi:rhodanese-related sulfurtransferase